MVASPQIEQRLAFETRTAPVEPAAQGGIDASRTGNQPDFSGGATSSQPANGNESAFSVDISVEAQRIAAGDGGNAARANESETGARQGLDATVETSATAGIGSTAGEAPDDGSTTNQVTSFEGERTGNDTRNDTEAGRTLGQVIDTFA